MSKISVAHRPLEHVRWRAIIVFICVSFGLAWLITLPAWLIDQTSPVFTLVMAVAPTVMMFTPAIAVLIVTLIMQVPATQKLSALGVWPLRPARRVIWFTALATLVPGLLIAIVVVVSAALGLVHLDLHDFSGFAAALAQQLPEGNDAIVATLPPVQLIVTFQIIAIPFAAIFNGVFAFGEELGWRGWLLPALRPLGVWPALLITGTVWGLWHSPLILLGYNYGITDWRGVALMTVSCILWGVLFGWSRLRSGSVWPAVIGHGGLNAAGGLVLLVSDASSEPNLAVVGPLGIVSWAVLALLIAVMTVCGAFTKEPPLAQSARQPEESR